MSVDNHSFVITMHPTDGDHLDVGVGFIGSENPADPAYSTSKGEEFPIFRTWLLSSPFEVTVGPRCWYDSPQSVLRPA